MSLLFILCEATLGRGKQNTERERAKAREGERERERRIEDRCFNHDHCFVSVILKLRKYCCTIAYLYRVFYCFTLYTRRVLINFHLSLCSSLFFLFRFIEYGRAVRKR